MKKKLLFMAMLLIATLLSGIKMPSVKILSQNLTAPRNDATWNYFEVYNRRSADNTLISQLATGTQSDPYLINTVDDLICFNYECNINTTLNASNKYVKFMASIDLGDYYWIPIGQGSVNPIFLLNIIGNNKTIKNMFVNQPNESYNGFIRFLGGNVANLVFENCHVAGSDTSGILAGNIRGGANGISITNVAINDSSVTASTSISTINGVCFGALAGIYHDPNLGGIGAIDTSLRVANCYVNNTTVTGKVHVGGLIGYVSNRSTNNNYFEMSGCVTNEGTVVKGEKFVGGMIGGIRILGKDNEGTLTQFSGNQLVTLCTNEATVSATNGYAGGIIGAAADLAYHAQTISTTECAKLIVDQSYNTGTITAGTGGYAAGIVGYLGGIETLALGGSTNGIFDCYNLGEIRVKSATGNLVSAGIVNRNNNIVYTKGAFPVDNCYQAGTISKTNNTKFYPITNVNSGGHNMAFNNCGANLALLNNEYDADSATFLTANSQATMVGSTQTIFTINDASKWEATSGYPILKNNKNYVDTVTVDYVPSAGKTIAEDVAYPGQTYKDLNADKFKYNTSYPNGTYKLYVDSNYQTEVDDTAYITGTTVTIYVLRAVQIVITGENYSIYHSVYKFTNEMLTLDDFKDATVLAKANHTIIGIKNNTLPKEVVAPFNYFAEYQQNMWILTTTGYGTNEATHQVGAGDTLTTTYLPNINRPGYDFDGWYKMVGQQETKIVVGTDKMPNSDLTVYPKFTAHTDTTYTIIDYKQNIDDDGYTAETPTVLKGTTDTMITDTPLPIYGFTALAYDPVTINGDGSTVLAFYYDRVKSDLTFNATNDADNVVIADIKYGKDITSHRFTPVKAGFTFKGWWNSNDGGQTLTTEMSDTMPYNDYTVYAKWEARVIEGIILKAGYPTTYELNGTLSSSVIIVATYDNGESEEVPVTQDMIDGFDTTSIGLGKTATITYLTKTTVYTYNVMSYRSVTYQKGTDVEGTLPADQSTVIVGTKIILPSGDNLTKFGYRFYDWSDGTNTYKAGDEYIVNENVVFTARMITKQTVITYEPNNGEDSFTKQASYSVGMPVISVPVRAHYTFLGYFLNNNMTQYYYSTGAGCKDWDRDDEAITLYAK